MGAANVMLTYANWSGLPHAPFRVLAFMALVTMDKDVPPRYFAGVEAISQALGRPECDHKDRKAVSEALTYLRRVGAIESLVKGSRGHRAEYALNLFGPVDNQSGDEGKHHAQRDNSTTLSVTKHHAQRDKAPRSAWSPGRGGGGGIEGGTRSPEVPISLAVVASSVTTQDDLEECPGCRFKRWEKIHGAGCRFAGVSA